MQYLGEKCGEEYVGGGDEVEQSGKAWKEGKTVLMNRININEYYEIHGNVTYCYTSKENVLF